MLPLFNALTFIIVYVNDLSEKLKILNSGSGLSRKQKIWLSFVLSAVLVSNSICWSYFERMSNKKYKACTLLGMFRRPIIAWSKLMTASVGMIIERYKLKEGVLLLDTLQDSSCKKSLF